MTDLLLPSLIGGPSLSIGLFLSAVCVGSLASVVGGVLVCAGVVLLAASGPSEAKEEPWCPIT